MHTTVFDGITFIEGAPARWVELFDRMPLQDTYSVPDGMSLTKVYMSFRRFSNDWRISSTVS